MNKDKLFIFDTTMRDGEQSPGASMTLEEKVRIGKALERMKVDVIEAGFAIASQGDFLAVKAVAEAVKDSRICSLARARAEDIDRAAEALRFANAARIHTFIATSPIHMKYKLRLENPMRWSKMQCVLLNMRVIWLKMLSFLVKMQDVPN